MIFRNLYFTDLHSAYEHAFRLADAVRASEEEEVNDCEVYIYNINGDEEQTTSCLISSSASLPPPIQ